MFKTMVPVLVLLLLAACRSEIDRQDLGLLNGYWEIDRVEGPDGSSRSYRINATIDFIQLQDMTGFRKKVQPQLDGSFITSDDAATFEIRQKDQRYFMIYKVDGFEWQEELLALDTMAYSVINEEHIIYYYKRYQPLVSTTTP